MRDLFGLALRRDIVRRALKVSLWVGSLLIAINHGDHVITGSISQADLLKMLLTYCVPYGVSTFSSVAALRGSL